MVQKYSGEANAIRSAARILSATPWKMCIRDSLEELPANVVKRVLKNAGADTRAQINQFLNYPENSAGSIMTAEFTDLRKTMTVAQAIDHIPVSYTHLDVYKRQRPANG